MNLDELERLEKEATPGPWTAYHDGGNMVHVVRGEVSVVGSRIQADWLVECDRQEHDDDESCARDNVGNAEAIAALRNAAPELIAAARKAERYRWRPMSEAPKDRCILVRWSDDGRCAAWDGSKAIPEWLETMMPDEWCEVPE